MSPRIIRHRLRSERRAELPPGGSRRRSIHCKRFVLRRTEWVLEASFHRTSGRGEIVASTSSSSDEESATARVTPLLRCGERALAGASVPMANLDGERVWLRERVFRCIHRSLPGKTTCRTMFATGGQMCFRLLPGRGSTSHRVTCPV